MTVVKWLITSYEKCRGGLVVPILQGTQVFNGLITPFLGCLARFKDQIIAIPTSVFGGRYKELVCILLPSLFYAVHPNHVIRAKGISSFLGGTNKFGYCISPGLDDLVAHPTHALRLLETILLGETQVRIDCFPNLVGIEPYGVQSRHKQFSERGLAGSRQAHH